MARRFLFLILVLVAMSVIAGCVTGSDAPSLYVGMSRDRLRTRFGEPLRVERSAAGGEDWYYPFSGPPDVQASSYHDIQDQSDSVSVTISDASNTHEGAVHLSPDGYVIEPLPRGHLAR